MDSTLPLWAQIILGDLHSVTRKKPNDHSHESKAVKTTQPRQVRPGFGSSDCLVLMAHGSRDPRWCGTFECLYAGVRDRFGENIRLAYMEFVGPTLMDIARECYGKGVRSLRVLPLFMAGGAHVTTDIPEQIQKLRSEFPALTVEAMAPIGEDPRMFAVIQEIIGEHAHPKSRSDNFSAA
jgi:sirohydrochlorin cobaltochelatase